MTFCSRYIALTLIVISQTLFGQDVDVNYRLSPNDKLAVSVFDEPELAQEVVVAANGMVTLPMINQIKVAGLSAHQAELAIANAYKAQEYLRNPQVTVTVADFVKLSVSILGEVTKPGNIEIPGGQQRIEFLTAIANAGDFKRIANKKKVKITRKATGRVEVHDVKALMSNPGKGNALYLYPGDVVSVPQSLF